MFSPNLPSWFYTANWIALVAWFCAIEFLALRDTDKGDTLSEHVWSMTKSPVMWFTFGGFMLWLLLHFMTRGKV